MRQRVKYSIGLSPTSYLNLRAKIEREMPTCWANFFTLHGLAGSSCIAVMAVLTSVEHADAGENKAGTRPTLNSSPIWK